MLALIPCAIPALLAQDTASVRGKLTKTPDGHPALQTSAGKLVRLSGDEDTLGVVKDKRLAGSDFEAVGMLAGDTLTIQPIHLAALYVHQDGRRLRVTYWCDICSIRTYTPGLCWCCREETKLDPREPDTVDTK